MLEGLDDDYSIAVQAAEAMAEKLKQDVCIMPDLSIRLLRNNEDPPLEIVRFVNPINYMNRVRK